MEQKGPDPILLSVLGPIFILCYPTPIAAEPNLTCIPVEKKDRHPYYCTNLLVVHKVPLINLLVLNIHTVNNNSNIMLARIHILVSSIVSGTRISLTVLVGHDGTDRLHHRHGSEVLRGNEF